MTAFVLPVHEINDEISHNNGGMSQICILLFEMLLNFLKLYIEKSNILFYNYIFSKLNIIEKNGKKPVFYDLLQLYCVLCGVMSNLAVIKIYHIFAFRIN